MARNTVRVKWRKTTIARSLSVLTRNDQKKIILVILIQISLSILDLIGVTLIGLLGALTITGVQSQPTSGRVYSFLKLIQLDSMSLQGQATILGLTAAIVLISRSLISVIISRKVLFFLSRRSAAISSRLISKLLTQSLLQIQEKTSQQTLYAVTHCGHLRNNNYLNCRFCLNYCNGDWSFLR